MSIHDRFPFTWKESRKKITLEDNKVQTKSLLKSEIDVLELKTRSYNALKRNSINTIDELIDNYERLPRIKNIGKTSVHEIEISLKAFLINNDEFELLERIG